MSNNRPPHILNAASNLLGISFVLITGLKLSGAADNTLADDLSLASAVGFLLSCLLSFASMRIESGRYTFEVAADYIFVLSMLCLFLAVLLFARNLV